MIQNVLIVGAGSAGLLAALTLKKRIPSLTVRILRDPKLGTIGVGEGTTPNLSSLLFETLGIPRKTFYQLARPTWKLGIRFLWGPRGRFDYTFAPQLDSWWGDLPRPNGYYCTDEFRSTDLPSALMEQGHVFPRQPNGCPEVQAWHSFHIENEHFVSMLESLARDAGIAILDGNMVDAERSDDGIRSILLSDGQRLEADLFIDCSGFRSELLGKALETPFLSFDRTLFCDRAVVGGWDRESEPILPYTTAEQMSTGWCWRIEHEHRIHRGYVYCSDMISDEAAESEFRRSNPKVGPTRIVRFRSGCYRKTWVGNVVAFGNAAGFVEPLEATALMVISLHIQSLVDVLHACGQNPTPSVREIYNELTHPTWLGIRDFLGLHYQPNTALDTPFWRRCREETDLSNIHELLDFYAENGPTGLSRYRLPASHTQNDFGIEGYLVMLVGMQVAYQNRHQPTSQEWTTWQQHRAAHISQARQGLTVKEALAYVRHPAWEWNADRKHSTPS
ncbi:tryptophan halogenase [Haloferula luteola]|uniref:Tryptophan halogenase n=1 Tax=Haloferula luteola TaxID=595692 RepID=A0A840VAI8_9BACT|nr:tryptophan 7-halogenase [Haloferula luteola]MBB5351698.1 tryptophan halogenase [Haloferula luteola]